MPNPLHVTAIVAAGGRGLRLGRALPKQLLLIEGRSVLERSVSLFLDHPAVNEVVVALPADLAVDPPPYLRTSAKPVRVVAGGARRQDSVLNAFRATRDDTGIVVVHDAARPFASPNLVTRTIAAALEGGAAVAAVPARDTVKKAAQGESRLVAETLPRESIFLAQTPQAFRREVLREALALGETGVDATDEASLAERAGYTVQLVEGESTNIKITTPDDWAMAETLARRGAPDRNARVTRVGTGYDLHRLVEGRPLILGGVTIPFEKGLLGFSDGDAVCHAVTDAVLGAAAAGDIGRHFPDTDLTWRDSSSVDLLRRAARIAHDYHYTIVNIDVTIIAERPKIWPFVDAMRSNVADAVGVAIDAVSIKGKTNEGVGAIGRGEALAVHAVALLTNS